MDLGDIYKLKKVQFRAMFYQCIVGWPGNQGNELGVTIFIFSPF